MGSLKLRRIGDKPYRIFAIKMITKLQDSLNVDTLLVIQLTLGVKITISSSSSSILGPRGSEGLPLKPRSSMTSISGSCQTWFEI
jgi:hypothetical protein